MAFPLHPETPEQGRSLEELFAGREVNIPEVMARLKAVAEREGLDWGERTMTYNSRLAQELGKWAEREGAGDAFHLAVFRAYFVEGNNIGTPAVLLNIAETVGLDRAEAERVIRERTFREEVDRDWRESRALGITMVPTVVAGIGRLVGFHPYDSYRRFSEQNGFLRL